MIHASDIAIQICGCATMQQHRKDTALIKADRAALVAEIVEWLRSNDMSGKWQTIASEIETKWDYR